MFKWRTIFKLYLNLAVNGDRAPANRGSVLQRVPRQANDGSSSDSSSGSSSDSSSRSSSDSSDSESG